MRPDLPLKSASSAAAGSLERFSGQAAIRFRDGASMVLMGNARQRARGLFPAKTCHPAESHQGQVNAHSSLP